MLDATKLIPEEVVPVRMVGRLVLDRNPDNFFAETEQVAFCPANIVPGIDFTSDPLLQGRLFSYLDTQLKRLGTPNFHQLPINAPKCPFANFQRDGQMQIGSAARAAPTTSPTAWPKPARRAARARIRRPASPASASRSPRRKLRVRAASFADHYSQARLFFRSMHPAEQAHIASAFVFELSKVALAHVRERMVANLRNVDEGARQARRRGARHAAAAGEPSRRRPCRTSSRSPKLRIIGNMQETLEGRTVGVLIADGSDGAALVEQLEQAVEKAGGVLEAASRPRSAA